MREAIGAHQQEHRDHAEGIVGNDPHRGLADHLQRRLAADEVAEAGDADQAHRHADGHAQQHQREQHDEADDGDRIGGQIHRYSTALAAVVGHVLGVEDQPEGADRDQQHGRDVAQPRHQRERPGRDIQIIGQHVVLIGQPHLVEQHDGLHGHDEQQHQRGEDIDQPLAARAPRPTTPDRP